jgi:hypothetical protein
MAQLLFDSPSNYVRLALRAYFTVLLLLLAFIGDRCCAKRVQLRLYNYRLVNISQATGWLHGWAAASALVSFRASPAGWLGIVMLLASLLGIICDLAVSGLVVTVDVVSRCPFNTTGIYTALSVAHFPNRIGAESAGVLFNLITQGQDVSRTNGGLDGIFRKVNKDTQFRADEEDIVGQWVCEATGEDRAFSAGTNPNSITHVLQQEGLLFTASNASCWNYYPDLSTAHLFTWSASQDDYPKQPWTVRAAVDLTSIPEDEKVMKIFACHMEAPDVDWVLNQTMAQTAMANWCREVKGGLYTTSDVAHTTNLQTDPGIVIASNLNSLIMNAGAAWNDTGGVSPLIIDDPTQGCLAPRALVSWPVLLLFGIVTTATVAMTFYWMALTVLVHSAGGKCSAQYAATVEKCTPNGLFSWMRQATHEVGRVRETDGAWTREWCFGPIVGQERAGLVRVGGFYEQSEPLTAETRIKRKPVPSTFYVGNPPYYS